MLGQFQRHPSPYFEAKKLINQAFRACSLQNRRQSIFFVIVVGFGSEGVGVSMVIAGTIGAIFAFALTSARNTSIEAFAVLLLTLTLLAVAPLPLVLLTPTHHLQLHSFFGLRYLFLVLAVVGATVAVAVGRAQLPRRETFTVHLETFGLLASAPAFLLLDGGGREDSLLVGLLQIDIQGDLRVQEIFIPVRYVFIQTDNRINGEVLVSFDEHKRVVEIRDVRHAEESLPQQVKLAHVLYYSLKLIQSNKGPTGIYRELAQITQLNPQTSYSHQNNQQRARIRAERCWKCFDCVLQKEQMGSFVC